MTGLESLRAEWDPAGEDPDTLELLTAARAALRSKTGAEETVHGNQVTAGHLQLASAAISAGIPIRDRPRAGNLAAHRKPIRHGPSRISDATLVQDPSSASSRAAGRVLADRYTWRPPRAPHLELYRSQVRGHQGRSAEVAD